MSLLVMGLRALDCLIAPGVVWQPDSRGSLSLGWWLGRQCRVLAWVPSRAASRPELRSWREPHGRWTLPNRSSAAIIIS